MRGVKKLTTFSRKLAFVDSSSKLDIRAPAVTKSCSAGTLGKDGCDGNHGADGPTGKANNALSNSLHSLTEIKRSCIYLYMELLEHNRCSLLVRHSRMAKDTTHDGEKKESKKNCFLSSRRKSISEKFFFFNYDRQFYFHNDCHLVYSKQIF